MVNFEQNFALFVPQSLVLQIGCNEIDEHSLRPALNEQACGIEK